MLMPIIMLLKATIELLCWVEGYCLQSYFRVQPNYSVVIGVVTIFYSKAWTRIQCSLAQGFIVNPWLLTKGEHNLLLIPSTRL